MIKRILVGLAGTIYTPVAIERAVTLAQAHDADVTGVTILDARRVRSLGKAAAHQHTETIHSHQKIITEALIAHSVNDFETACKDANIRYRVVEETGDAFSKLVDLARYHDLMVFGLRSVLEYDFMVGDPVALLIRLVGAGVRPLLAVSEKYRSISRVVIAYSGSMESAKAMKRFVQMRLWPGVELCVVTFNPSDDQARELAQGAEEYCRAHGYKVSHRTNPGDPKILLLAAATLWQADMIVMGNSARTVLMRNVLGDTLLNVLHDTTIPLFLAQ